MKIPSQFKPKEVKAVLSENWFQFLTMAVMAFAVMAPILGNKIGIGIFGVTFATGLLSASVVYMLRDVIHEVYGHRKSQTTIILMTLLRVIVYIALVPIVLAVGTKSEPSQFADILTSGARILIASELAILLNSILVDSYIFQWLKKNAKLPFPIRMAISDLFSKAISSSFFVIVAYVGTSKPIQKIIFGQVVMSYFMTLLLIPVGWALVTIIRKK